MNIQFPERPVGPAQLMHSSGKEKSERLPARGPACSILLPRWALPPCSPPPWLRPSSPARRAPHHLAAFLASSLAWQWQPPAPWPSASGTHCRALQLNARWMDRTPRPHCCAPSFPTPSTCSTNCRAQMRCPTHPPSISASTCVRKGTWRHQASKNVVLPQTPSFCCPGIIPAS
jgi:hypothetical protein